MTRMTREQKARNTRNEGSTPIIVRIFHENEDGQKGVGMLSLDVARVTKELARHPAIVEAMSAGARMFRPHEVHGDVRLGAPHGPIVGHLKWTEFDDPENISEHSNGKEGKGIRVTFEFASSLTLVRGLIEMMETHRAQNGHAKHGEGAISDGPGAPGYPDVRGLAEGVSKLVEQLSPLMSAAERVRPDVFAAVRHAFPPVPVDDKPVNLDGSNAPYALGSVERTAQLLADIPHSEQMKQLRREGATCVDCGCAVVPVHPARCERCHAQAESFYDDDLPF